MEPTTVPTDVVEIANQVSFWSDPRITQGLLAILGMVVALAGKFLISKLYHTLVRSNNLDALGPLGKQLMKLLEDPDMNNWSLISKSSELKSGAISNTPYGLRHHKSSTELVLNGRQIFVDEAGGESVYDADLTLSRQENKIVRKALRKKLDEVAAYNVKTARERMTVALDRRLSSDKPTA